MEKWTLIALGNQAWDFSAKHGVNTCQSGEAATNVRAASY